MTCYTKTCNKSKELGGLWMDSKQLADKDFGTETENGLVLMRLWGNLVWPWSYASSAILDIIWAIWWRRVKMSKWICRLKNPATRSKLLESWGIPTLLLEKIGELLKKAVGVHEQKDQLASTDWPNILINVGLVLRIVADSVWKRNH